MRIGRAPSLLTRMRQVLTAVVLLFILLGVVGWLLWSPLHSYLSNVTGEEDSWEQLKGFGRLLVLRFTNPPLKLQPECPMAHTGVNPFGINTFLEQEVEPEKVERALQMIRDAGFRWIRQEFPWEDIEPSARGDFWDHKWNLSAWDKYDRIVDLANQYDIQIIARLDNPPAWSRNDGDARGTFAPPDDLADFGDFVYAVAQRYRGKVKYYQIWNEPNIYPEWGDQPVDATAYVRLLQVAYLRAKEADPDCVILCAGLAQTLEAGPRDLNDLTYLQQMYDAGVKGYFDIMGVMAYGLWTGPRDHRVDPDLTNYSRPQLIRQIMVRNGDADKPLWATEVGWNALPLDHAGAPVYGRVDLEQQARYAVQAYQRAQQEWPWMGVLNYWFFKRATDTETDQVFYYFRMVEPDFAPLPVFSAMESYANAPAQVYPGYFQEDHWALVYEGEWEYARDGQAVLGAIARSHTPGSRLRFAFVGTDIFLVVHKSPEGGLLHVRVDGGMVSEINLMNIASQYGACVPLAQGLPAGSHQVEIENASPANAEANLDGLIVRNMPRSWKGYIAIAALLLLLVGLLVWHSRRQRRRYRMWL
jgi:polysaccharide biosynthesis protein PslG